MKNKSAYWLSHTPTEKFNLIELAHTQRAISNFVKILTKKEIPVEFFEGLTDLQSTGYAEGFILAQLYWCQEKYTESKEMLQSLLSYFGSSLPESPPTHDLWNQIDSEFGTRLGRFNPRKLPWAESRSKRYWQLVLDMEA